MHNACPGVSGMTGNISVMRAPAAYNGTCGPGTFVIISANVRRVMPLAARAPLLTRIGRANLVITIALPVLGVVLSELT